MEKSVMVVLYLDSQVVCREKGKESLYFILLYFIVLYCILLSENKYSYFYSSTEKYQTGVEFCSQMLHI